MLKKSILMIVVTVFFIFEVSEQLDLPPEIKKSSYG